MSTTVLEALQNALFNFNSLSSSAAGVSSRLSISPVYMIGIEQLKNCITALENGKSPNEVIQENMLSEVDVGRGSKK